MKNIAKYALLALLLVGFGGVSYAQKSLSQTTLSSAQNGDQPNSGASAQFDTFVNLASGTGITLSQNGQPVTILYIDQEAESVLQNPSGTIFTVLRGQFGTRVAAHASGTMVLFQIVSPQFAGFSGGGGLQVVDPPVNGACTAANTLVTPWVNMISGDQWLCSSLTGTWVPGWHNKFQSGNEEVTAAVASAAGLITPSGPLFHITGALAITGFNTATGGMIGFNATAVGGGQICVIPDGTFTTTTANNIALASTAVVNKELCWVWDATNQKFIPTY